MENPTLVLCPNCQKAVRVAGVKNMTEELRKEFFEEVINHNLEVQTMSLADYRKSKPEFCLSKCENS